MNPLPGATITPTLTSEPWQPAQLRIPALHIDAPVIGVGATKTGVMDAPTSKALHSPYWTSVFWYKPGTAPGQAGNAVIAGHVDRIGGDPAIFWSLNTLTPGEKIAVGTVEGKVLQFEVNKVVRYPADAPDQNILNAVFGSTTEHHLNLITCSGVWTSSGYDERLVVFTTQVGT
ncbi:MAG: class F sortase [Chloroflexota bacterium]|nr:class F sortase [Chloroflexota bacterium]